MELRRHQSRLARRCKIGLVTMITLACTSLLPLLHAQQTAAPVATSSHVPVLCDPFSSMPKTLTVAKGDVLEFSGRIRHTEDHTGFKLTAGSDAVVSSADFYATRSWKLLWDTSSQPVGTHLITLFWSRSSSASGDHNWTQAGDIMVKVNATPSVNTPTSATAPVAQAATGMVSPFPPAELELLSQEMALVKKQKYIEAQIRVLKDAEARIPNDYLPQRVDETNRIEAQIAQIDETSHLQFLRGQIEYKLKRIDPHLRDADRQRFGAAYSSYWFWYGAIQSMEQGVKAQEQANSNEVIARVNRGQKLDQAILLRQDRSALALKTQLITFLQRQQPSSAFNDEDTQAIKRAVSHKLAQWNYLAEKDRFDIDLILGKQHLTVGREPGMEAQSPEFSNPQSPHYMGQDIGDGSFLHSPQLEALDGKAKDEEFAYAIALGQLCSDFGSLAEGHKTYEHLVDKGDWYGPRPALPNNRRTP